MKKLTLIISALALVLGISQCKKPNMPSVTGETLTQKITVNASNGNGNAKINIEDDVTNKILNFKWSSADNDQIKVSCATKPSVSGTLSLIGGSGQVDGKFDGTIEVPVDITTSDILTFTFGEMPTNEVYAAQDGTLEGMKTKLCATGTNNYNPSRAYNVEMSIPYAIVKLDLHMLNNSPGNVTIGYDAVTITLANVPATAKDYYVMLPAGSKTYTFTGTGKTVEKAWDLAENMYYRNDDGSAKIIDDLDDILPGKFSIAADKQIQFSRGNLWFGKKAGASNATWNLEEHQYDYTVNTVTKKLVWDENHICHFSWQNYARIANSYKDKYVGRTADPKTEVFFTNNQDYSNRNKPNPVFVANGHEGIFRVLTGGETGEWYYLMKTRTGTINGTTKSAEQMIGFTTLENGVYGIVILPDEFNFPEASGHTSLVSSHTAWNNNTFTLSQWHAMELAGAVFMPCVGLRKDNSNGTMDRFTEEAFYWSSMARGTEGEFKVAYNMEFDIKVGMYPIRPEDVSHECHGMCVRLVVDVTGDK